MEINTPCQTNYFKDVFKFYKRKDNLIDLSDVLDFRSVINRREEIVPYTLQQPDTVSVAGLKPLGEWTAYTIKSYPGFVYIVNPFVNGFQRYWIMQCLKNYPNKPNKTNLDIHINLCESDHLWDMGINNKEELKWKGKNILQSLRWATLGFHHNWDTKEYSKENRSDIPKDLQYLSSYIAGAVGYNTYNAEAAIINYYHLDSTLSGHNDHSEFDKEAPLISVSFGHTAIFLLGGQEQHEKPVAMYIRSGDMLIMMGPSRLNYHAVPRIIATDTEYIKCCMIKRDIAKDNHQSSEENVLKRNLDGSEIVWPCKFYEVEEQSGSAESPIHIGTFEDSCSKHCHPGSELESINSQINSTVNECTEEDWDTFENYLLKGRINMNIRQVFPNGVNFDTIS